MWLYHGDPLCIQGEWGSGPTGTPLLYRIGSPWTGPTTKPTLCLSWKVHLDNFFSPPFGLDQFQSHLSHILQLCCESGCCCILRNDHRRLPAQLFSPRATLAPCGPNAISTSTGRFANHLRRKERASCIPAAQCCPFLMKCFQEQDFPFTLRCRAFISFETSNIHFNFLSELRIFMLEEERAADRKVLYEILVCQRDRLF